MKCVFCDDPDVASRRIANNDLSVACLTNIPITPGHVLIMPKRHVGEVASLTAEELLSVRALTVELQRVLRHALGSEGFNIAFNEGEVAGQSVAHFHVHIVPRTRGDSGITEYEPRKFLYRPGSRSVSAAEELQSVAALLRAKVGRRS